MGYLTLPIVLGIGYGVLLRLVERTKLWVAIVGGVTMTAAGVLTELILMTW